MKALASTLAILLACQAAPAMAQAADAGTQKPQDLQREDEHDARQLQLEYQRAYSNRYKTPPYSVEEISEKIQTLPDGNQIRSGTTTLRYRDQNGRVRVVFNSYRGKERIAIADPRALTAWLIRPERKDVLRIQGAPAYPRMLPLYPRPTKAPDWSRKLDTSLGVKEFEGIMAVGIRSETFYAPGARGNEREMVETSERWRSNELSETVYYRTNDPRYGESITRLHNLKYGELAESLFSIPPDYPVRDTVFDVPATQE